MTADQPLFELQDVVVEVDGRRILDGVSACIPAAGVTCIVGPSGSGKSTLLRLCNRLEVATSGVVRFRGQDLMALDPLDLRRRVGMVFQRPTPFPGTVRENLLVARPDASHEQMVDVLERAALDGTFLDRVADELSGGEQQRMCLARTLLVQPEALLMDEATSALDDETARLIEGRARRVATAAHPVPVLWVTHDLDQVERIADTTLEIDEGRIVRG